MRPFIRLYREQQHLEDVPLRDPIYVIGRGHGCTFLLDDEAVSRKHAMLRGEGDRYVLEDGGSPNGTMVNDQPITRHTLAHGDRICLGRFTLIYLEGEGTALIPPDDSAGMHIAWSSGDATNYVNPATLIDRAAKVAPPVIEALDEPGRPRKTLEQESFVVGRGLTADLQARSLVPFVKAMALLSRLGDRCKLTRLAPLVLLRLNGRRYDGQLLDDGDVVQVGSSHFLIHLPGRSRGTVDSRTFSPSRPSQAAFSRLKSPAQPGKR